jgi:hypothetical protein
VSEIANSPDEQPSAENAPATPSPAAANAELPGEAADAAS